MRDRRPRDWPSRQRSVAGSATTVITTGSVRGKCCASQAVQRRTWPPRRATVGWPQAEQKPCRRCQSRLERAWARMPVSGPGSTPPAVRQSSNRQPLRPATPSAAAQSGRATAKCATPSARPRNIGSTSGAAARTRSPVQPAENRLREVAQQDFEVAEWQEPAFGGARGGCDPCLVAPLPLAAVERVAGEGVLVSHVPRLP